LSFYALIIVIVCVKWFAIDEPQFDTIKAKDLPLTILSGEVNMSLTISKEGIYNTTSNGSVYIGKELVIQRNPLNKHERGFLAKVDHLEDWRNLNGSLFCQEYGKAQQPGQWFATNHEHDIGASQDVWAYYDMFAPFKYFMKEIHRYHNILVNMDKRVAKERAIDYIYVNSTRYTSELKSELHLVAEPLIYTEFQ
jgi:hypothetical protein